MNVRFIIACIVSSAVMFGAFYFWHGIFLNDLSKLSYSRSIFFVLAPIAYVIISIVVAAVNRLELASFITKNLLLEGFISGAVCGLFIYIISVVVGISFSSNLALKNMMIDIPWQMIEQGLGGAVISFVYILIPDAPSE